jgi:hypothetical protein
MDVGISTGFHRIEALAVTAMAIRNRKSKWRKAAEEARAIAESTHDPAAKQTMLELAERYDALAKFADEAAEKSDD